MKDNQEVVIKVIIFMLVLVLLVVEALVIEILYLEIIIKFIVLALTLIIIIVESRRIREKAKMCRAFIYQHRENRSIVYCENDEGDETRDFRKIGEGQVRCDLVSRCSFAR